MRTDTTEPSIWAPSIAATAISASLRLSYSTTAEPFGRPARESISMNESLTLPKLPKISAMCSRTTLRVRFPIVTLHRGGVVLRLRIGLRESRLPDRERDLPRGGLLERLPPSLPPPTTPFSPMGGGGGIPLLPEPPGPSSLRAGDLLLRRESLLERLLLRLPDLDLGISSPPRRLFLLFFSLRLSPFGSVKLSVNSPFDDCESPFTFTFTVLP